MITTADFEKKFTLFTKLFKTIKFRDYSFIFTYHLNDNNAPYLDYWVQHVETLAVISIPYSEVKSVKEGLAQHTEVISPSSVSEIPTILEQLATKWSQKKIILVEIGGYSSYVSDKLSNVVLSIEDTNQGHWNQINSKKRRDYPVVSMAQSEVKKLENRVVGESIVSTSEKLLGAHIPERKLPVQNIGTLSYGGIGSSVCLALRKRGLAHKVYDNDPMKLSFAYSDGYTIAKRETILSESDIIIGSTGKNSVTAKDIALLKDGAVLISGSSKQIEFFDLFMNATKVKGRDNELFQEYEYKGKRFTLVNQGQPINFLEQVPPEIFEPQLSAIISCVKYGLENTLTNDVHSLPMSYQIPIFELFVERVLAEQSSNSKK